jgi:hypothetical protein
VWARPWAPLAVAAAIAAVVAAGLAAWVLSGHLPGVVADALLVLALVVLVRHRTRFTDPGDCTGAGMSVMGFAWLTAVACGLVVSTQRATWVWGAPVAWWVHVLVALGIVGVAGAASWLTVLVCFLVSEDAAFLGAGWGVLVGLTAAFCALWLCGVGIWAGMLSGLVAALLAGPLLTVLLRVRLVPREAEFGWDTLPW